MTNKVNTSKQSILIEKSQKICQNNYKMTTFRTKKCIIVLLVTNTVITTWNWIFNSIDSLGIRRIPNWNWIHSIVVVHWQMKYH